MSRQKFISHFQKLKIIQSEFDLNLVAETFNLLITKEMNGEDFRDGAHFHRLDWGVRTVRWPMLTPWGRREYSIHRILPDWHFKLFTRKYGI